MMRTPLQTLGDDSSPSSANEVPGVDLAVPFSPNPTGPILAAMAAAEIQDGYSPSSLNEIRETDSEFVSAPSSLHEEAESEKSLLDSPSNAIPFVPIPVSMSRETLDGSSQFQYLEAPDDEFMLHSPSNPNGFSPISTIVPHGETLGDIDLNSPNLLTMHHSETLGSASSYSNLEIIWNLPYGSSSRSRCLILEDEDDNSSPASPPTVSFCNNLLNYSYFHQYSPGNPRPSSSRGTGSSHFSSWGSKGTGIPGSEIKHTGVGAGLQNLGNTCYMNAILQCFTHTMPLVQGLCSLEHISRCDSSSERFCILCALRDHIELSIAYSGETISPENLVDNLNNISTCFQRYEQEDAHEFLQCFLERLERCLDSKTMDTNESSQYDNIVAQVFGGRLVSKLQCCNCWHYSETYEPLIDMSLEIGDVDTLSGALESFTKVEVIEDPETNFTCDNCKEKVLVAKQLMLDQAPSVAAFHLKRFKTDGISVNKIDNHIEFPLELDLQPYTSGSHNDNVELKYELYAFVVHVGPGSNSGHYFCFVRSAPDTWYELDDWKVRPVEQDEALNQKAYILFYARKGTPWFSSLMETMKPCLDDSDTSPKSVLDNVDTISIDSKETEARETRDDVEGISTELQNGVEINDSGVEITSMLPLGGSIDCGGSSCNDNSHPGTSNCIPRDHLRSKKLVSFKRCLRSLNYSRKRYEVIRYVRHSMPLSRGRRLINAVMGPEYLRRERRKRSSHKRAKVPSLR